MTRRASRSARAPEPDPGRRQRLPSEPGTYALLLELTTASRLPVGRLGLVSFEAPVYLYTGSAFGPGGLSARVEHHLDATLRPHWHIDSLRRTCSIAQVWTTTDARRLECVWASAARSLRDAVEIPGFGSSDCRCSSHLVALTRLPARAAFRRHLRSLAPPCHPIRLCRVAVGAVAATDRPRAASAPSGSFPEKRRGCRARRVRAGR